MSLSTPMKSLRYILPLAPSGIRRRRPLTIVISLATAILLFLGVVPVQASNFGATTCSGFDDPFADPPDNCVSLGNNHTHMYEMFSVRSDIDLSFRTVIQQRYDPTDLETGLRSPADVKVQDNTYDRNGVIAWVNCPPEASEGGSGTSRWCYGQDLRFNLSYSEWYDSALERQFVSCHEFGHTVGLRHTTDTGSCLNSTNATTALSAHDVNHINAVY